MIKLFNAWPRLFLHFMLLPFVRIFLLSCILLLSQASPSHARVSPQDFQIIFSKKDSAGVANQVRHMMDSLLKLTATNKASVVYNVLRRPNLPDRTTDFYLLIVLALILGFIRYGNPRYYALLIGAFRGGSGRQWREMLQAAALANLGMNVFFCAVSGLFLYYLSEGNILNQVNLPRAIVVIILMVGMMAIYCGKLAVIKFTGWIFHKEHLASEYLFNVFLINKIIGIVLLPFVVIIAFAGAEWLMPMALVSGLVILGLLATRYLRSWSSFYELFKGSRFHFFTYLCASEILPMAVLVKWLLHLIR